MSAMVCSVAVADAQLSRRRGSWRVLALLALPALRSTTGPPGPAAFCAARPGQPACSDRRVHRRVHLGSTIESLLPNNAVQAALSGGFAHAISQNKGPGRGEDIIVTSGSNGAFNVSLLMDGHGGQDVVRHAGRRLQEELLRRCGAEGSEAAEAWPACARASFAGFQDEVRRRRLRGGATAIACFLRADGSQAAFAWVGDSSAVVIRGGDVLFRTTKHSLDNEDEVVRIEAGGYRYFTDDGYLCTPRGVCVAPTRALGDIDMESAGLTSAPEASEWIDLQTGDLIVAASDGVWDVLPEAPVVRHLAKMPPEADLVQAASGLAESAVREWARQYGRASEADDISVLIYRHPPRAE